MTRSLGGPREGSCHVRSWLITADGTSDGTDHGVHTWADAIDSITVAGGTRPTFDLFDIPQPDGAVRRYRAVSEGPTTMTEQPSVTARIHQACGKPMHPQAFDHHNRIPQYRSQPIWACGPCSAWEPREGWDGPLPAEWDGSAWRN